MHASVARKFIRVTFKCSPTDQLSLMYFVIDLDRLKSAKGCGLVCSSHVHRVRHEELSFLLHSVLSWADDRFENVRGNRIMALLKSRGHFGHFTRSCAGGMF